MELSGSTAVSVISASRQTNPSKLIMNASQIKTILYLGLKGVSGETSHKFGADSANHTIDTFA